MILYSPDNQEKPIVLSYEKGKVLFRSIKTQVDKLISKYHNDP